MDSETVKRMNLEMFKNAAARYDNETTTLIAKVLASNMLQFEFGNHDEDGEEATLKVSRVGQYNNENTDINSSTVENVNTKVWNPDTTRVLDFACGTGLLSQAVSRYCKQIIGADITQEMVDIYNHKLDEQKVPAEKMRGYVVDVTDEEARAKDGNTHKYSGFDVIMSSLAYHHIYDIEGVTKKLAGLLNKGGCLLIGDTDKTGVGSIHGAMSDEQAEKNGVSYRDGFQAEHLCGILKDAGLTQITAVQRITVKVWGPDFLADGFSGLTGKTKEVDGRKLWEAEISVLVVGGVKP